MESKTFDASFTQSLADWHMNRLRQAWPTLLRKYMSRPVEPTLCHMCKINPVQPNTDLCMDCFMNNI